MMPQQPHNQVSNCIELNTHRVVHSYITKENDINSLNHVLIHSTLAATARQRSDATEYAILRSTSKFTGTTRYEYATRATTTFTHEKSTTATSTTTGKSMVFY